MFLAAACRQTPARYSKTKSLTDYRAFGYRLAERSLVHRRRLTLLFGCRLQAETGATQENQTRLGFRAFGFRVAGRSLLHRRRLKLLCWPLQADTGPAQ